MAISLLIALISVSGAFGPIIKEAIFEDTFEAEAYISGIEENTLSVTVINTGEKTIKLSREISCDIPEWGTKNEFGTLYRLDLLSVLSATGDDVFPVILPGQIYNLVYQIPKNHDGMINEFVFHQECIFQPASGGFDIISFDFNNNILSELRHQMGRD